MGSKAVGRGVIFDDTEGNHEEMARFCSGGLVGAWIELYCRKGHDR